MITLSENSMKKMTEILSTEALDALDMVDRGCKAIDWSKWSSVFTCLEALGLISEDQNTSFNRFVHNYSFTELGARIWKFYLTTERYRIINQLKHSPLFLKK